MFKGKQIKSLEQETTKLGMQSENHEKELKNINGKLADLEKLMESTKESLNQLSASRFESISKEIQEFNTKMETSMESLDRLQKNMGELNTINSTISDIKRSIENIRIDVSANTNSFQGHLSDYETNRTTVSSSLTELQSFKKNFANEMASLQIEFNDTRETVQRIKSELQEERKKVIEGQETIMKQEATINEKSSQLERLDNELKESRALIGRLQAEKDNLEKQLYDVRDSKDKQYQDLTKMQSDFSKYKQTNEGQFTFNAAVKKLMEQSTEGAILLELFKKSPVSMDVLADKLQVPVVKLKTAINTLQDINAVKVDAESRMISL